MKRSTTRRTFVAAVPAIFAWFRSGDVHAAHPSGEVRRRESPGVASPGLEHPEPRKGIDASLVLSDEALENSGEAVRTIFALVREMPQIADGIACYCGCDQRPNYRSLLTCFYADGMARGCQICQGEAKLAHRRWKEGQSLDQIRRAVDARYA